MNAHCSFNDIDTIYDLRATWIDSLRKARKRHVCIDCRREIPLGSKYAHRVYICDGTAHTYKQCAGCKELSDHFIATVGRFAEEAEEALFLHGDISAGGPCLEGLSPDAKAKLFEYWRRWKGVE